MQRQPFFKIFAPFVLGLFLQQIFFANYVGLIPYLIIALCIVLFFASTFLKDYVLYKAWWLQSGIMQLLILVSGFAISMAQKNANYKTHYSKFINDSSTIQAVVQEPIIKKPKSYKTILQITKVINGNKQYTVQGNALCYFTKTDTMPNLLPGDIILCKTNFIPIKNNGNIGEFDYKAYCNRKNILHSSFISKNAYVKTYQKQKSIYTITANWRLATIATIKKYITNPYALGIAEALLIGDRTDIDQETWDAYSRTGIVHIIAISGMHMGIIYSGILMLLCVIPIFKKHKEWAITIAVVCMWLFACVTGLPASVMRAAVMFTIVAGATILQRDNNSFNALAVSAFLLLCYNPQWLQDVGFQLSYAAVIGIMLFAKPIQNLIYTKYKVSTLLWQLISGTLAAQIFTFPLCLYYFHQFPLIFLISNIVAIPLTTIILYAEIVLIIIAIFSNALAVLLGKIITGLILFLNQAIHWLSTFKNITIYNVHCNMWQTVLLFACVCLAIIAIQRKKIKYAFISLACVLGFYIIQIANYFTASTQQKFIVHHLPKASIINYIQGYNYQLISLDSIKASDVKNAVEPSHIKFCSSIAKNNLVNTIQKDSNYILMQSPKFNCLILGKNIDSIHTAFACKYVILTHNSKASIQNIYQQCQPACIIADGSNSLWKIEQWQNQAKDLHLQFFSTQQQGAFVANL